MQLTILALGSRGDVLPYALLGQALVRAGYQVRLATFEGFRSVAAAHGLVFHPVRGDAQAILRAQAGISLAEAGQNTLLMWRAVMRSFGAQAESYAHDLSALGETDAILNQLPGGLYGMDLAEQRGIPMLLAAVMPLTRTRAFPMPAFPPLPLALPCYHALTYRIAEQILWQAYRPAINAWRTTQLGLAPWPRRGYYDQIVDATPVLNGFSPLVVPRPPDWGDHVHVTGYWLAQEEGWQPPDRLLRFLDAGSPPVFVGFGSMPLRDPRRVTEIVLDALRSSGQRGILHAGWADLGAGTLPPSVLQVDYVPYRWLFPRVAAVVHHGGSGTTASGLRAGVPTVVVPFVFDQFFWGRRIVALGVGPRPVPYRRLSAVRLALAIEEAASSTGIRRRAAALGARIREEDGLAAAVRIIDHYLRRQPPASGEM